MEGNTLKSETKSICKEQALNIRQVSWNGTNVRSIVEQAAVACGILPEDVEDVQPGTPIQEEIWTASTKSQDAYTYELLIEVKDNSVEKIADAWRQLVRNTPMLRSCLVVLSPSNRLVQVVLHAGSKSMDGHGANLASQVNIKGLAQLIFSEPCAVSRGTSRATLRVHHALFDGWAMRVVLDRLKAAYQGEDLGTPPDFRKFIEYLDDHSMANGTSAACDFWRTRLEGCSPADIVDRIPGLDLKTDSIVAFTSEHPMPEMQKNSSVVTRTVVAHGAWAMLAGSYAATDDVLFGTVVSGRDVPVDGILDMMGPTMAVIPCRVRLQSQQPVAELCEGIACDLHAAAPYQHVGLSKICGEYCGIERSRVQTLLVCQPSYLDVVGFQAGDGVGGPDWTVVEHVDYVHPYALVIECWLPRGAGPVRLKAYHDTNHISSSQARMVLEQLSDLILKLATSFQEPSGSLARVGDICLASQGDLQRLQQLNATCAPPVDRCIHDLFADSVRCYSESIAVDAWDEKLTYARVDELSDALMRTLVGYGVGQDVVSIHPTFLFFFFLFSFLLLSYSTSLCLSCLVYTYSIVYRVSAPSILLPTFPLRNNLLRSRILTISQTTVLVFFPKSAWVVVAVLAVLKAGGAFVSLEPAHPDGRIGDIALASRATIAISHVSLTSRLAGIVGAQLRVLDLGASTPSSTVHRTQSLETAPVSHSTVADPSDLAYIMFTSGTTGVPKGVSIDHRAVCSSILARAGPEAMNMTSSSRVLQFSSYCFDAFIDEVLMTMMCGACVCIPHAEELRDDLCGAINRYQITWAFLTPAVARILVPSHTPSLHTLAVGGEKLLTADIKQWKGHVPELRMVYGATECCVISVVGDNLSLEDHSSSPASLLGTPRGCLACTYFPPPSLFLVLPQGVSYKAYEKVISPYGNTLCRL